MAKTAIEGSTPTRRNSIAAQAMKTQQRPNASAVGNDPLQATPPVANPKGTGATLKTGQKQLAPLTGTNSLMAKEDENYRIDRDVRTLHEAHQIRNDGMRHARAKARIKDMMKAVGRGPSTAQMAGNGPDADTSSGDGIGQ